MSSFSNYNITEQDIASAKKDYQLNLCKRQGRLFALASAEGYNSKKFIQSFMKSELAKGIDSVYNRYQWVGEDYWLQELMDEIKKPVPKTGEVLEEDVMYWIGYLYRFWHFYKDASSKDIFAIAPYERMNTNYLFFHSMSPEMAVDDLIEIYKQKKAS